MIKKERDAVDRPHCSRWTGFSRSVLRVDRALMLWCLVLPGARVALAQGGSPARLPPAPLLERQDTNRSQFAGSNLRRVQSFGQPSEQPGATDGAGGADLYRAGGPLNARVYKDAPVMGVYLNGVNIVGLRSQTLRGVTVRFDEHGNILIDAPHYDVQLDTSFHPLLPSEVPGRPKETAPLPPTAGRPEPGQGKGKSSQAAEAEPDPLADP